MSFVTNGGTKHATRFDRGAEKSLSPTAMFNMEAAPNGEGEWINQTEVGLPGPER